MTIRFDGVGVQFVFDAAMTAHVSSCVKVTNKISQFCECLHFFEETKNFSHTAVCTCLKRPICVTHIK